MIENTISKQSAQRFYDRIGAYYDLASFYEAKAKEKVFELLELETGMAILNAGCGTGKEHLVLQAIVGRDGLAVATDISSVMVSITHRRTSSPTCQADIQFLPFVSQYYDRLISTYVLDLVPAHRIGSILVEYRRILKPGGRLILASLTEGATLASQALVGAWKRVYTIAPLVCGGCRPLRLRSLVEQAELQILERHVIVQLAVPSEIICAQR